MNYTKVCEFCGDEFKTTNTRKKFCTESHRVMNAQVKSGKKKNPYLKEDEVNQEQLDNALLELEELDKQVKEAKSKVDVNIDTQLKLESAKGTAKYKLENLELTSNDDEGHEEYTAAQTALENQIENHIKKLEELETEYPKLFLTHFRLEEKRNDLYKSHFIKNKTISGSELFRVKEYTTTYPFNNNLWGIGEDFPPLEQPFIVSIIGGSPSCKSLFATSFCEILASRLQGNTLYILDRANYQTSIEYLQEKGLTNENLNISRISKQVELNNLLREEEYEFLIIDDCKSFGLNSYNLNAIQEKYPKLSIVLVSEVIQKSILDISSLVAKCEQDFSHVVENGVKIYNDFPSLNGYAYLSQKGKQNLVDISIFNEPYESYNKFSFGFHK